MGPQAKGPPDPVHRTLRQSTRLGHAPGRPVGRVLGQGVQGEAHDLFHVLIQDGPRRATFGRVAQSPDPVLDEASSPDTDRVVTQSYLRPDLGQGEFRVICTEQDDPGAGGQTPRGLAASDQRFKQGAFFRCRLRNRGPEATAHGAPPPQAYASHSQPSSESDH